VRPDLEARGLRVFEVSTASHEGLRQLTFALGELVERARAAAPAPEPTRVVLRPRAVDEAGFTVTAKREHEGTYYEVRGSKPERWVRQTDFNNDEAVGFLADRLAKLGVEDKLLKAGAVAGDEVRIGDPRNAVVFDWEPTLTTGPELLGVRGTDLRLDESSRPTRSERRREFTERMDAKTEARRELWTERESGHWTDPDDD
jgi:GTP-binding protein